MASSSLKILADNSYISDTSYNNARFVFDSNGHTTAGSSSGTQPTYYYNQVINHLNNMMQYTGNTSYIDEMFTVLQKIRNIATQNVSANASKFGTSYRFYDNFYDWPSGGVVADLWEQHGMRSVFEFFYWLDSYSAEYPQYQAQVQEHFQWFKTNLIDKWISRGYNHIFETNTWMTSHFPFMTFFASKLLPLGVERTTYENIYKAFVGDGITMTSIYNSGNYDSSDNFKDHMFIDPVHGGYSWYGEWDNAGSLGDINHQSAEVELVYKMYLSGYYFTSTDIDRLVTTTHAVLDGAVAAGFTEYEKIPWRSDAVYRASDDDGKSRNFGMAPGFTTLTGHDATLHSKFNNMSVTKSVIKAGYYTPVFYSDRMLGEARIEGAIAMPLFGVSTTPPVIIDPIGTDLGRKQLDIIRIQNLG